MSIQLRNYLTLPYYYFLFCGFAKEESRTNTGNLWFTFQKKVTSKRRLRNMFFFFCFFFRNSNLSWPLFKRIFTHISFISTHIYTAVYLVYILDCLLLLWAFFPDYSRCIWAVNRRYNRGGHGRHYIYRIESNSIGDGRTVAPHCWFIKSSIPCAPVNEELNYDEPLLAASCLHAPAK